MHTDSTGQPIRIGDKVLWRGKIYTIAGFRPCPDWPLLSLVDFVEERQFSEQPHEVSVNLIRDLRDLL
jgi:hypothetical protein